MNDTVDEAFIRRAVEEADLNALRMALYQATGDERLATMPLKTVVVRGGAGTLIEVADDARAELKDRAARFLRTEAAGFEARAPSDPDLRRMMDLLTGETLSDKDFAYRRDIAAFDEHPRAAAWTNGKPELPEGFHVAIIGAGFSGIAAAVQFQRLGVPYTVYERQPAIGGTWSRNTYPDVRVDTTNFVYQYSFEKNYPWSEYFARAGEVRGYIEHVARKFGVYEHIRFNSDVTHAAFDGESAAWKLTVDSADGGAVSADANVIVAASGLFNKPKPLEVKGIETFKGTVVHSARWTDDSVVEGRRVAVIGNGSTGVQMLAKITEAAERVYAFQRSPQWIAPRERYGQPISAETRWLLDTMPYYANWYIYLMLATNLGTQALQEPDPEWQKAGGLVSERNDRFRESLIQYIEKKVGDRPDLMEKLTPTHAPMARRLIVDNGWYESLLKNHVELVTDTIEEITPTGIRTADGQTREVDVIVTATGFSVTQYMWPTQYTGLGGVTLEDRWTADSQGPRAYMGMMIPDFPNLFMLYGPNSQPRSGSLPSWMEIWSRYAALAVVGMIENGRRRMSVRPEVFQAYNDELDARSRALVWHDPGSREKNYYVNEFGRQQVNASWRVEDYYQYFAAVNPDDFEFDQVT